eukprot:14163249-Alexandrium_andersonii.AAC.1
MFALGSCASALPSPELQCHDPACLCGLPRAGFLLLPPASLHRPTLGCFCGSAKGALVRHCVRGLLLMWRRCIQPRRWAAPLTL